MLTTKRSVKMKLIIFLIIAAIVWFGYTNLGKPLNLNKATQSGQQAFQQEKTIDRVINTRNRMNSDADAMKERI